MPLGRIIWDHAVHPGCWLCLLSRAFSSVQTVSEVNPSTAVERARCCHCVCQVSFCFIPTFWVLHKTTRLSTHGHACDFPSRVAVTKPNSQHLFNFLLPGWFHQFRPSWPLQLATSLLLPVRTSSRTSKSSNAPVGLGAPYITCYQAKT